LSLMMQQTHGTFLHLIGKPPSLRMRTNAIFS